MLERATEPRGLVLAGELFVERLVIVVAGGDTAAITAEGDRDAVAAQEGLERAERALGGFREKKLSGENLARSVVLHIQRGERRALPQSRAWSEPRARSTAKASEHPGDCHFVKVFYLIGYFCKKQKDLPWQTTCLWLGRRRWVFVGRHVTEEA